MTWSGISAAALVVSLGSGGLSAVGYTAQVPAPAASTVPAPPASSGPVPLSLGTARRVEINAPSNPARPRPAKLHEPRLFVNKASLARQKTAQSQRKLGRREQLVVPRTETPEPSTPRAHAAKFGAAAALFAGAPSTKNKLRTEVSFDSYTEQLSPPDTQLSVGHKAIVLIDNGTIGTWRKDQPGKQLGNPFQLQNTGVDEQHRNGVFDTPKETDPANPEWLVCDPWVVYDPRSHVWVVSVMVFNYRTNSTQIQLAVSDKDNPRVWHVRNLQPAPTPGILHDQPKLGITDDKLVIAWTDYKYDPRAYRNSRYLGGAFAVLSLAAVEDPSAALEGQGRMEPDECHANPITARSFGASDTAYIVATVVPDDNACLPRGTKPPDPGAGNDIWIVRIEGPAEAAAINAFDIILTDKRNWYTAPPQIKQFGSNRLVDGGDTRLLSAVWQNDRLWTAGNGSCIEPKSQQPRGCFRIFMIDTSTSVPTLRDDTSVFAPDRHVLYPALAVNSYGDVFASALQVGFDRYISVAAYSQLSHNADWLLQTFGTGRAPAICPEDDGVARIGDYSGVDLDPSDKTKFWAANEIHSDAVAITRGTNVQMSCYQNARVGRFSVR